MAHRDPNLAMVTASALVLLVPVIVVVRNSSRLGLLLYNNSANSAYLKYGSAGNSGTNMTFIMAAFSTWVMPPPIYNGEIWAVRNSGTGVIVATELT